MPQRTISDGGGRSLSRQKACPWATVFVAVRLLKGYHPLGMDKARVLIVDDQEEILNSLDGVLRDEGHEVISAKDGQEALHLVQTDCPDLVFLDIWIPGIDGMQTLKAIKRLDPHCSVVMMSGHGTIETAVKAIKLGATDYLEKPLNLEDVLHLVQKAVQDRTAAKRVSLANGNHPGELIGASDPAQQLRTALQEAATQPGSIWLAGEKGTGKEFAARIIHHLDIERNGPLVKVRCPELTDNNISETLHGKSSAGQRGNHGRLDQATGGTLVLLRIDKLDPALTETLLQALQQRLAQVSDRNRIRILTTSVAEPGHLARIPGFSNELIDLLTARIIYLPSLRERRQDIGFFVECFLREAAQEFDRDVVGAEPEALSRLERFSWPGNIKQLKTLIEHMVMTSPGGRISANDLLIPNESGEEVYTEPHSGNSAFTHDTLPHHHGTAGPAGCAGPSAIPAKESGLASVENPTSGFRYQKTLRGRAVMYGMGLHSGIKTGLTLSPLPPGSGILFGHITSAGTVPATISNVESTGYATCLQGNGVSARTIEHLMAVFHVYGLTNALVKISGEVPIMDGSGLEFCNLVESAEIIRQDEVVEEIIITEPLELPVEPGSPKRLRVEPAECFQVEYSLDYPPPVGSMKLTYALDHPEDFKRNIAPARTFGFVKDMRTMEGMGLADGGRLSNVVLVDDEKVVNPPLRFPDEFVRHKVLDIIGDFYLLGRPVRCKVIASQTGHTENIAMLKLIRERIGIPGL